MSVSTFKFDSKTNQALEHLREHYGAASKAEVLRKAIAVLDIVAAAEEQDQFVVIESKDGKSKRQILVR